MIKIIKASLYTISGQPVKSVNRLFDLVNACVWSLNSRIHIIYTYIYIYIFSFKSNSIVRSLDLKKREGEGGEATRVNNENINEPWIYYFSLFVPLFVSLPLYRILLDGTEDRKCFNGTRQVENRAGDTWPPTL